MEVQSTTRKRSAARVLESATTPLNKIQKLVDLGYEEIDAETMVASQQFGPNHMVYYEQLPDPEYGEDSSPEGSNRSIG